MRLTETKLRQVIKEEIVDLLNEMEQRIVKEVPFSQLQKAQKEVGTNFTSASGADFSGPSLDFKSHSGDEMIPIIKTRTGYAALIKTETQMKPMEFVISREVAEKLGINVNPTKSVGTVAGLPANLRSLHGLQESIRRLILKQLKEVASQQAGGGIDYNRILNYLVQNWSGPNGYYKLLQENPKLVEEMKRQFAGQNGIKTVSQIQPPSIMNNMIYGSKMTFVANDGKTYKFNYAPTFSSLTDENGGILATTR